jgi:phosphate-selective porin
MAGDAINLQTTERMLNPFFVSRNVGLRWYRRVTTWLAASAGVFNDGWTQGLSLSQSGTQVVTRIAFLPVNNIARNRFVHFAIGGRYNGADNDSLRFKGRPESNVSSSFVDTGNLPASHENEVSLEMMVVVGRFTVSAEHVNAFVHSPQTGNPVLSGSYVAASWFLQPVRRPYDPAVSFARRPIPGNAVGAVEFAGRLSRLDMDDAGVTGGTMTTWYGGVNWWVGTSWRVSAGYVHSRLDRFGTRGTEHAIHTRIQFLL